MHTRKLLPSLLILSFLFNACGTEDIIDNTSSETLSKTEKTFVHNLFLTEYLWYDKVTSNIDYSNIKTSNALIDALRVSPPDKWSFSMTSTEYDNYVNQNTEGFGFGYTSEFIVYLVRIGSPAYGKLHRGDQIISINGKPISTETVKNAKKQLNTPSTFSVLRAGSEVVIEITPKAYNFQVAQGKIILQGNRKIGYLRYDSFSGSSISEFETVFTSFKNTHINDLVIDLRYNGGGSITVASTLLDNITNQHAGQRQGYLDWNANMKQKNENFYFSDDVEANDLNMKRVFFLVTKNSASASELVISALKPYLGNHNVITIGTETHGKNVGMSGRVYGDNYYFLINFFVRNNANEITSFNGIPPTCLATDDITHAMGDKDEAMLSTALYYIAHDICP